MLAVDIIFQAREIVSQAQLDRNKQKIYASSDTNNKYGDAFARNREFVHFEVLV